MSLGGVNYYDDVGVTRLTPVTHRFSDEVWDPFYPFPTIQSEALADAACKWTETAEEHVLTVSLPVVKKEEVTVVVESGGVLKISGKRKVEIKEVKTEVRVAEEFVRRVKLPENAVAVDLKAAMKEDGVLTVTVPKGCDVKVVQIA